ncbi:MAG: hypothetical protein GXP14_07465 [Gammaproteobacteria bacterium]|nr:hypothetical protein [Gammaproteobacteria bacterium]
MGITTTIEVKESGLPVKIELKEWIESDLAKSLESEEDFSKWGLFGVVDSLCANENYECSIGNQLRFENHVYAANVEGVNMKALKTMIGEILISLRDSAIALKLEGMNIGSGRLIIQDRMGVVIDRDGDYDDISGDGESTTFKRSSKYKAMWYGCMTRMPEGYEHKPHNRK